MQKVSDAYKERIRLLSRDRGYIMISFGLVNQEAQAKARIDNGKFSYYSNISNIFNGRTDDTTYATLEENFSRVDGTMFFLPRQNSSNSYYDTGIIGDKLVSEAKYELTINLHTIPIDFKGITIDFGENYPVDFDMVSSTGQVVEFRNNTEANFATEEVLTNTTSVKFIFYKMKNEHSRLRIYSIRFGYGLVYKNDDVMDSSLESYISPIGADVPQIDFSVTLKNYDHYFNVDNPNSAINFLETGQEMDIYYGYRMSDDGDIEWIRGNHLLCSEWESDDFQAVIKCQDVFRNMESEYEKGLYRAGGISYFDLAVLVLQEAGESNYYIDPRLKKLYTKNPMPRVTTKEALQIIANACRCTLSQTRAGGIMIKSNFLPDSTISSTDEAEYSNVQEVLSTSDKDEYASFATSYATADGRMYFIPRDLKSSINTGFVSKQQSDANGNFTSNPVITIVQEAQCMYHGVSMTFGNALPAGITLHTYNNGELVEDYVVEGENTISKRTVIIHDFDDFDTIKIEFTKTAEPYNRIVLNSFSFGDITDFTMSRTDMLSSPKAIKQELIKEVVVVCYNYQSNANEESLISQDVENVSAGETETYYVGEPSYGYRATLKLIDDKDDNYITNGVTIVDSGSYYITVKYTNAGSYRLEILGHRYKIVEQYATKTLNARGKSIKWENPLISDMKMARDLSEWLGDYYKSNIEYEYDHRGFPELDVNDIIYQENEFHDHMKINVYRNTLTFNGAFGGKLTGRRQGM